MANADPTTMTASAPAHTELVQPHSVWRRRFERFGPALCVCGLVTRESGLGTIHWADGRVDRRSKTLRHSASDAAMPLEQSSPGASTTATMGGLSLICELYCRPVGFPDRAPSPYELKSGFMGGVLGSTYYRVGDLHVSAPVN
jgi:hypothetical protein